MRRGEAKLAQLAAGSSQSAEQHHQDGTGAGPLNIGLDTPTADPETKDEGRQRWDNYLRQRFITGDDDDFDYDPVDADDSLDVLERREEEDAWFDDEEPKWSIDDEDSNHRAQQKPEGETGIQDF